MNLALDTILVFKTSVRTNKDKMLLAEVMTKQGFAQWTIDQDDADCVLRVINEDVCAQFIINKLNDNGFLCIELT